MKQIYGIMALVGAILLILGAASVYALTTADTARAGMMENNQGAYRGMMGTINPQTRDQMNILHDQMIKNLDPETAKQMDAMHDACMGNSADNS